MKGKRLRIAGLIVGVALVALCMICAVAFFAGLRIIRTSEDWFITKQQSVMFVASPGTHDEALMVLFVCKDRKGTLRAIGWTKYNAKNQTAHGNLYNVVYDPRKADEKKNFLATSRHVRMLVSDYRYVGGP